VREHARAERVIDTRHAKARRGERSISFHEIMHVLCETGIHEKAKDEWKVEFTAWNYAIRGITIDGLEIRIPVFFIDSDPEITYIGIATVVNLSK
jgi:hypothetical protein